ncbi:MAG: S41 family peptidase [Candidatus Xenobiia bacterium LiM19]
MKTSYIMPCFRTCIVFLAVLASLFLITERTFAAEEKLEKLTMNDVKDVISTVAAEFYKPVQQAHLLKEFAAGLKDTLKTMGLDSAFGEVTLEGSTDRDIEKLNAVLEKTGLGAKARSTVIFKSISKMLQSLDEKSTKIEPYSIRYRTLREMGYDKGGAGLYLDDVPDSQGYYVVLDTLPGFGPEQHGMQTGDRIIMVDGERARNRSYKYMADAIRGPIGTDVSITFERPGDKKIRTVTIRRRWLAPNFKAIDASVMNGDVLYVRIKYLGENVDQDLHRILQSYEGKGIKKLIFDLRNNGGTLEGGRDFAGSFLPEGTILLSRFIGKNREVFRSSAQSLTAAMPMVIILNQKSAPPSGLFAGIMQDYGKAVVVGATPEWKEGIDTSHNLPDGSTYSVTSGYYVLPKGRVIMYEKGVIPDIQVKSDPYVKYPAQEDRQLKKALEILTK